ncbi:hypothetical protein FNV43_RR24809 [Rhamnella rubrinervis]|uniref:Uncharacterized protein n=1 Tax=Rhamnella rubrinervis TaxID=2594499 RepID=A0A8K0GQK4_9ROSA|nr:hypothetical protein FNV43_RR24809 [Rhamnella rubrinervis]
MKQIPIPKTRRSTKDIVFITWNALTSSMKQVYGQPLHYLTRLLAKQWDRSRNGADDEEKPMEDIIPPGRAESIIWDVEEIHRLCTSYSYLAELWVSDPDYHAFVDEVIIPPS